MSKYKDSILTTAGLQLASKAYAGKTTFKLTRTATTVDVIAADKVKTLMVLPHEVQAGTITQGDSVVSDDHTLITTELLFTNKDLKTGYSINAIGVYALEAGTDKEILYSVAIAEQAEYMPDFADKVLMEFKATITMAVGQISNVTIEMIANNLATQQYVQNAIKDLAKDSEVVHDNHDGNIVVNSKSYDITKFQQAAITASDGGPYITVGANEKIVDKLKGLSAGLYTIDINSNNNDLPSSNNEAFGIVERVYIANATTPYYYSVLKLFNAIKPNFSTIMFDDGSHRGWDGIDNLAVMIPASKKSGTGLFAFSTSRIRFKSINDVLFVDCFADLAAKPSTNGWLNLCALPDEVTALNNDVQYHYLTGASQGSTPVLFRFDTKAKMLAVMASTTSDVYSASGAIVI
ncbi:hypothetical protein FIV11_13955 [Lactiplantibacillus plantarum]|uniref:hypothetical protein n=1 Tax=Lactiplantibacillus plantarum TaxID=1590 RepID=UPI002652D2FE|nr:hypothetical protein [Lactiplantibacillus plantarum]MDN7062812.1 hypothetical protein [Lactiplantibacillus plantarum]